MRTLLMATALAAFAAAGAERLPAAAAEGGLEVRVDAGDRALVLANRDTVAVYYTMFERRLEALVDWAPCRDPARCAPLPPSAHVRVAFDSIPGYQADAHDVIVYLWKLKPATGGTFQPDGIRSHIVMIDPAAR